MPDILQLLCFCTYVAAQPTPPMAREAGDIWYHDEITSPGRHTLRLSTSDRILDSNEARTQRLYEFAADYAAQMCDGRFDFVDHDSLTTYATQYVFRCGRTGRRLAK